MPNITESVLTVVIGGTAATVGISVISSVRDSVPVGSTDFANNTAAALDAGISNFFSNLPVVFTVIALVLIISYLVLLRR
jgi:phage tail sheath gpL-like